MLFLFLFNVRTAIISAAAIPVSLLGAVAVLETTGIGLNIMVLGGLAIAIGEVVDDAIIDMENIFRRLRENRGRERPAPPAQVILDASIEVRASVVYATFIVVLGLLSFADPGRRRGPALRAARPRLHHRSNGLATGCHDRHPGHVLPAAREGPAAEFGSAAVRATPPALPPRSRAPRAPSGSRARRLGGIPRRRDRSAPALLRGVPAGAEGGALHRAHDRGTGDLPGGIAAHRSASGAGDREVDGVQSVAQWVGRAPNGPDTAGSNYSEFEVEVGALTGDQQERVLREIRATLAGERGGFPGVNFSVNTFLTERIDETVSGYSASLVVSIFGPALERLDRDAAAVAAAVQTIPGVHDVQIQAPAGAPQVTIRPRPDRLRVWGVSPLAVADTVRTAYEGTPVGQIYEGTRSK